MCRLAASSADISVNVQLKSQTIRDSVGILQIGSLMSVVCG